MTTIAYTSVVQYCDHQRPIKLGLKKKEGKSDAQIEQLKAEARLAGPVDTAIEVHVKDNGSGVVEGSISISVRVKGQSSDVAGATDITGTSADYSRYG